MLEPELAGDEDADGAMGGQPAIEASAMAPAMARKKYFFIEWVPFSERGLG